LAVKTSSVVRLEEGIEIELIPMQFVSRQLYFFGSFEPQETHTFRNLIGPGMTVFDIGANIGLYTLIAAKALRNQGQVFSFEPSGETFALLERNIKRNGFQHLVHANRCAVSSTSGHARFLLTDDGGSNHLDLTQGSAGASGTATDVKTVALDSFVDENKLSRVDVIKSDAEGAEMQVLAGAKRLLEEFKPHIFIEFSKRALNRFGHEPEELLDLLVSLRYKPYVFCSSSYRALKTTDNISNRNLLFLT
jgi:FkbM family methyltransferase